MKGIGKMKIVWWNPFNNGDIHVSRSFVRLIIKKVLEIDPNTEFFYSHKNDPGLLLDVPNLSHNDKIINTLSEYSGAVKINDTIFINTWYAQQHHKFMNQYGISFDALYAGFDESCKTIWNFSLSDISADPSVFFPSIDYSKFSINYAKNWINQYPEKKIFVANGYALSGQSHNFPITPLIMDLAKRHRDKIFILSNKDDNNTLPNVFWSTDIIKKIGCDLNENAFLSEHCDVIIGRPTGAFTFSQTTNNMINRKCKILCFTNITSSSNKFWLSDLLQNNINYSADIKITNESNINEVKKLIEERI